MRWLGLVLAVALASGCASILGIDDATEAEPDAGFTPPDIPDAAVVVVELYVDPSGDDSNDGSIASPFLTLSHAASVAQAGWIIRMAPGTYVEAPGTVIDVMAPRVEIFGDTGNGAVEVVGNVVASFIVLNSSRINGVTVNNIGGDGISLTAGGAVESCTIDVLGLGISSPSFAVTIRDTNISNSGTGIAFVGTTSDPGITDVSGNSILNNTIGLDITTMPSTNVALGFANEISCNNNADVRGAGGGTVDLSSNSWDHIPPDVGNLGGGIDITSIGGTMIIADDPNLVAAPCN